MDPGKYSTEQWVEQQHAEAVELLQAASYYVLATVDSESNIKILDGCPGQASPHDEHCALSMLKSFAKFHLKTLERRSLGEKSELDE